MSNNVLKYSNGIKFEKFENIFCLKKAYLIPLTLE